MTTINLRIFERLLHQPMALPIIPPSHAFQKVSPSYFAIDPNILHPNIFNISHLSSIVLANNNSPACRGR